MRSRLAWAGRDRFEVLRDQVGMPVLKVDGRWLDDVPGVANIKPQTVRKRDPIIRFRAVSNAL